MHTAIHNVLKLAAPAALALAAIAGSAQAATITVHPGDITDPDTSNPLGVQNEHAPGFATGAFKANGTSKTANVMSADMLFGTGSTVTIGDLQSFSYWTYQDVPDSGTPVNWYVEIYTKPDGINDDSWYGRRLNFEPYFSENRSEPDNTWVQWSTDGSSNKLRAFDANRGKNGPVYGTYTDPFLSDLTSGTVNWSNYSSVYENQSVDYRDEVISFIGLSTGSGWADYFNGLLDGFEINWNSGNEDQTTQVNFEAENVSTVPEPSALFLFALGLCSLLVAVGHRHPRKQ